MAKTQVEVITSVERAAWSSVEKERLMLRPGAASRRTGDPERITHPPLSVSEQDAKIRRY